jgi:hypothetical protein
VSVEGKEKSNWGLVERGRFGGRSRCGECEAWREEERVCGRHLVAGICLTFSVLVRDQAD